MLTPMIYLSQDKGKEMIKMSEYWNLEIENELVFHDTIVDLVKEGLSITQIKQDLLNQALDILTEGDTEAYWVEVEVSGGLTKSGNPELLLLDIIEWKERQKGTIQETSIVLKA